MNPPSIATLLLVQSVLGFPEGSPLEPSAGPERGEAEEHRAELDARSGDLVRTDARLARAIQELGTARRVEAESRSARDAALAELRTRLDAAYRLGRVSRIAWAVGDRGPEVSQALVALVRQAKVAEERRARASATLEKASNACRRLEAEVVSARALWVALDERTRSLRRSLGLPEAPPPAAPERAEARTRETPPAQAVAPPPEPPRRGFGEFVHPVWSTLPLLWAKREAEAPILRYPAYDGALVRAPYDGRVVSIERVSRRGKVVRIDHGSGLTSVLTDFGRVTVEEGAEVERGGILGRARGPVHFELEERGANVDPRPWMGIPVTR